MRRNSAPLSVWIRGSSNFCSREIIFLASASMTKPFGRAWFSSPSSIRFRATKRDPDLIEQLLKGADYIIRKSLKFYAKFLERGMIFPPCQRAEELKFGAESTSPVDRVRQFVAECCELEAEARTLTRGSFRSFLCILPRSWLSPWQRKSVFHLFEK